MKQEDSVADGRMVWYFLFGFFFVYSETSNYTITIESN